MPRQPDTRRMPVRHMRQILSGGRAKGSPSGMSTPAKHSAAREQANAAHPHARAAEAAFTAGYSSPPVSGARFAWGLVARYIAVVGFGRMTRGVFVASAAGVPIDDQVATEPGESRGSSARMIAE